MSFESFFSPASVAIVGASREKGKVGYEILQNLLRSEFPGKIWPVNPKADSIEGVACYHSLEAIGQTPELVIVVVPAKVVPGVMKQCASIGVKAVVVISAGFKEVGREGAELERELLQIARESGIRVIGPNCLGLIVPATKLNASFGGDLPAVGSIAYLSQSGALLAAILDMANASQIGFSKLISIGNKADMDELDIIRALGDDPDTKVIAGYLENITNGDDFVKEAEQISSLKPILLMKSGGTQAGAQAASSHTGSLAGLETAYECAFERGGIIRCPSIEAQFDYAQAFAYQPLPAGEKVAIITNAGGPGIMATDAIEREGLTFAKLSDDTKARLAANLPAAANVNNPIDVLGDALADRYEFALRTALADRNVDIAIVLLTPQAMTESTATAEAIVKVSREYPAKPVLACFIGASKVEDGVHVLRGGGIPQYESPERAAATVRVMARYVRWRSRPKRVVRLFPVNRRRVEMIIGRHLRRKVFDIGELESKEILEAYGFSTPRGALATTAEQAANIADQLGYPVVLKIWSPDILHKSDVGGVRLNLNTPQQVMDAFDLMMLRIPKKMPDAEIMGVFVQEMVKKHQEVILGMKRDPQFGPMMMFGMGGIYVEVLKDVSFYLAPLTAGEARKMLVETKTYGLLKGARGQEGIDIDSVAEGLQRLSQLVTEFPQIQEMDINPFVVGPVGTRPVAVDARIRVAEI